MGDGAVDARADASWKYSSAGVPGTVATYGEIKTEGERETVGVPRCEGAADADGEPGRDVIHSAGWPMDEARRRNEMADGVSGGAAPPGPIGVVASDAPGDARRGESAK